MRINKVLWYIPLVGIIYMFYLGFKYGFMSDIVNIKTEESLIGLAIHVVAFVSTALYFYA